MITHDSLSRSSVVNASGCASGPDAAGHRERSLSRATWDLNGTAPAGAVLPQPTADLFAQAGAIVAGAPSAAAQQPPNWRPSSPDRAPKGRGSSLKGLPLCHFHCIIPDGLFVRESGSVRFIALAPPSDDDVVAVLCRIVARLERLLRPRLAAADADARSLDALGAAQADALHSLGTAPPDTGRAKRRAAYLDGFSLHAAVHLHANDREGLAHLCGYGARPPFSQERLSALPDGRLTYRLKRPLGDGRQAVILRPTEFLRRLATLVPPPRAHLVRYHGVFAPASGWRSQVIPPLLECSPSAAPYASARHSEDPAPAATGTPASDQAIAKIQHPENASRIPWAELLMRVFREHVLACPCGGRRVVLAYLTQPGPVKAILDHLGLPSTGPRLATRPPASSQDPARRPGRTTCRCCSSRCAEADAVPLSFPTP